MFAVLFGQGSTILQELTAKGLTSRLLGKIVLKQLNDWLAQVIALVKLPIRPVSPETFQSEDIPSRRVMCFAAMGRDDASGQFRLGGPGETALRVQRVDKLPFDQDPVYGAIKKTINQFGAKLTGGRLRGHRSPFAKEPGTRSSRTILGVAHPLGGCRIGVDANDGVVDEFGRAFGYEGLYVADAAVVRTSLGVNPSLTVAALALRIARQIVKDHYS